MLKLIFSYYRQLYPTKNDTFNFFIIDYIASIPTTKTNTIVQFFFHVSRAVIPNAIDLLSFISCAVITNAIVLLSSMLVVQSLLIPVFYFLPC